MNSGVKFSLATLALAALSLAGCADRGPDNLYSQPLFGVTLAGPHLTLTRVQQDSLNPSLGLDGLVLTLKNDGGGAAVAPIKAQLSTTSACAVPLTYGASVATAVFGSQGGIVYPGDSFHLQAVDQNGAVQSTQYAFVTDYDLSSCAGASVSYSLLITDAKGGSWSASFNALAQ